MKTTPFKKVSAGLGYRINPDHEGNRWLKSVNVRNKDFYSFVPQEGAVKGVMSTDAEAAPEPPSPPAVRNGRFSQFFFGDDLQEDGTAKTDHSTMLLTSPEVLEMTGLSTSTIYQWMTEE